MIDKVTLKFRWKAVTASAFVWPMYRQGGIDKPAGATTAIRVPADGYVDDAWQLSYNPATGRYWTAAEVNGGMEFGFRKLFNLYLPRVTQAYVEVTYRTATDSTVYIGGVYEKKSTGAVTKYYGALGRTIAVRTVPTGAGQGTLSYLLADHLGSTVGAIDAATGAVTTQKYWPYGGTRAGGVPQTDKLYTRPAARAGGRRARPVQLQGAVLQHGARAVREC